MSNIVEAGNITKHYRGMKSPALDHIDLKIRKGEIFGLLGPNGAGKTTLINILSGVLKPDSGKVIINGLDVSTQSHLIKPGIGIVPQEIALYPTLTVKENLIIFGSLYNIPKQILKKRIADCLSIYGLENKAGSQVKKLSGGMKRRLNIIAGILHKPELLILDEPTAGIDVQSKVVILDNLRKLNQQGTTILYTSHYMDEAEKFCSYTSIIDYGKMIAEGSPAGLVKNTDGCNSLEDVFIKLTGREIRE
jgi:ABC-2 type transport system ATP-binding protein